MSFQYVLIPAIESEPITSQQASKAGGLTNDALSQNAKKYFAEQNSGGSNKRAELLEKASSSEKTQIANKIRKQYTGDDETSKRVKAMSDDEIIHLLKLQEDQQSSSCEITCLTIPTPLNGHTAVSMYGDDHGRTKNRPYNTRATNLMLACGHAFPNDDSVGDGKPNGIYGDVFVGRAIDDEAGDVWERVDLTPEEVQGDLQKLPWCKIARRKGGGGGRGGAAASLSKTLQNFQNQQTNGGAAVSSSSSNNKDDDNDGKNYSWTQTDDEVELKFVVPKETKAKNVSVKFANRSVKVSLVGLSENDNNKVLCDGETWDQIDVDGSTFTLQDEPGAQPTGRELCVSLEKQNAGQTWNYAIEE